MLPPASHDHVAHSVFPIAPPCTAGLSVAPPAAGVSPELSPPPAAAPSEDIRMKITIPLVLLSVLHTSLAAHPLTSKELHVRTGEMVALHCPRPNSDDGEKPFWTSRTMNLTNNSKSPAELRRMGVLLSGKTLIILNASENHQADYFCSFGSSKCQSLFRLIVHPVQSKVFEQRTQYPLICFTRESCRLSCPDVNIPPHGTPNMSMSSIVWHKDGDPTRRGSFFPSADEKDSGVYTCTRHYLYDGHEYNISFRVALQVKSKKNFQESRITHPQKDQVFYVDLDAPKVINCTAVLYSEFDDVFWLSGDSFVENNDSLPVFTNYTRDGGPEETRMTASLVLRKVSKEDLLKRYICKLESDHQSSSFVTITLRPNGHSSSFHLALCIICFLVVITVTAALCLKFKINISLYLRDTLGCSCRSAGGKIYDAYLMGYKSDADSSLDGEDRKWLVKVLEEQFGYSLFLSNQTNVPEGAAEAVLDRIEQSGAVVLFPTTAEHETDSDVLIDIHAALLKRGTRFILINTETTGVPRESSLPETVQVLTANGDRVTWKGSSSKFPSSSFCKQLRYRLPAPQHAPRLRRQRNSQDANC